MLTVTACVPPAASPAKPRIASPARAASIVAFSASRFVCAAIPEMRSITAPIRSAPSAKPMTSALVSLALAAARSALPEERANWPLISSIEVANTSLAAATVWTLHEVRSAVDETMADCAAV